ncbi:hypothetical protein [Microcoleus sp. PH2017_12_PCY_D_A]|uniref:hypothetical protein n=1 Tax=Microcoleus sp. PH2017_12_PCY_D_A TaxID=2798823 RepID=UPI0025E651DE|nr:hypothetical protein [Microcoleus sp. PH2017_12_PCY_D_A]
MLTFPVESTTNLPDVKGLAAVIGLLVGELLSFVVSAVAIELFVVSFLVSSPLLVAVLVLSDGWPESRAAATFSPDLAAISVVPAVLVGVFAVAVLLVVSAVEIAEVLPALTCVVLFVVAATVAVVNGAGGSVLDLVVVSEPALTCVVLFVVVTVAVVNVALLW